MRRGNYNMRKKDYYIKSKEWNKRGMDIRLDNKAVTTKQPNLLITQLD